MPESPVTHAAIVSQMRDALALSEPDLDTTVGTPTRKILDAVGEVIAEAYVDRYLLEYQYDIDAKTGEDLDDFVRLFGFSRFPAKRATGTVIFERMNPATDDVLIPVGTQLATEGVSAVVVQTSVPALLLTGESSVQVPVQATVGGAAGNVPSNGLRRLVSSLEGINSFTNVVALSGGADAESDEQLRSRFKRTVFRSMAGTEQMFLGTALDDEAVTQANVIGAAKLRRESIEVVDGQATSVVQDSRYTYPGSQTFGQDIDRGIIFTPGVHYVFSSSAPPSIEVLDAETIPDGVYDLEFEYVPQSSRNDPQGGITNRVDVYVNGSRPTEASEVVVFRTARVFNNTADDPLQRTKFERPDGSHPLAGSYFVAFAFTPVIDPAINQVITIDGVNYTEGEDFFLINDVTREGGTPSSLSGIEFLASASPTPPNGTLFQVEYVFNAVPRDVELATRAWRLITTDVRVHQAKPILLNLYLAIMFEQGYSEGSVLPELEEVLSLYLATIGFNGVVQVSDLLEVCHRVPGVDAVRFLTDADGEDGFAIQRVSAEGNLLHIYATEEPGQVRRALDVLIGDDEYPVFNSLTVVAKGQNRWGAV